MIKGTGFKKMKLILIQITLLLLFRPEVLKASPTPFGFWKAPVPSFTDHLAFTSAPQTVTAATCSGALVVESQDVSNAPKVVGSDLTVNLSGTAGVTYYSDSFCAHLISSTTIANGQSNNTLYFISLNSGAVNLSATATSYNAAAQAATINTNNFRWTGATADGQWGTGGNWSGGSAPGGSDVAVFHDSFCSTHCNLTIAANPSAGGARLMPGYTGTITQANGISLSFGGGGWIQFGGTFAGSNASTDMYGLFSLGGGTYTATSNTLTTNADIDFSNSATFNHHGGTLISFCGAWAECFVTPGSAQFKDVIFDCVSSGRNMMNPSVTTYMNILGNLTLANAGYSMESGVLGVAGNVVLTGGGKYGSTKVKLVGNPLGQTITGSISDTVPGLEIATGANNVTLNGTIVVVMDYTVTSIGTLVNTGSTLRLACSDWIDCFYTPGSVAYNHVVLDAGGNGQIFLSNYTMSVSGDLTVVATAYGVHDGTLNVSGNLNVSGQSGGNFNIKLVGSTSKNITTAGVNALPLNQLTVQKTGGAVVSLTADLLMDQGGQGFSLVSGSLDMANHNMTVDQVITLNSNTLTKNGGTLIVNGVTVGTGALYGGTVAP